MTPQTDQAHPPGPAVAVAGLETYDLDHVSHAIEHQIDLLGGIDKFVAPGDSVLIKPNFITPRPADAAVQTHPSVIIALARILKDCRARPFVGDSPAWGSIQACAQALGLVEPLKKLGVPLRALDRPQRRPIDGSLVGISKVASEADCVINVPKFKAHQQLVATFAVKNMFGCVCGKRKPFYHLARGRSHEAFCRMLIGIYTYLNPALSIIDAIVAMQGQGPIRGNPKKLGFIIAGADPIACESVCCDLIDLNPDQLPIIQTARRMNFGCADLSQIRILGDDYRQHRCTDFQFAELTPLHFSPARVCKSICRQILIQAGSVFTGRSKTDS